MKNLYLFLGLLVVIIIGLLLSEQQKQPSFTKLNSDKFFFHKGISVKSTIGNSYTQQDFINKISLVFFGYTKCPDFCPNTLMQLNNLYRALESNKYINIKKLQIVFISVDTKKDDIDSIRKYVQYFNKHFIGLRLNETDLKDLAKSIGIYYKKTSSEGDIDFYEHTGAVFIIDKTGKPIGIFTPPFSELNLKREITTLIN